MTPPPPWPAELVVAQNGRVLELPIDVSYALSPSYEVDRARHAAGIASRQQSSVFLALLGPMAALLLLAPLLSVSVMLWRSRVRP